MECGELVINQLILHCKTEPSDNELDFSRVNQVFIKRGVFVARYSNFTVRITRKGYVVLFLFQNIYEIYSNLENSVLKYVIDFIDSIAKFKLLTLSYKVKNIHLNSFCNISEQTLLAFFMQFYKENSSLNHNVKILDETGAEFDISSLPGSFITFSSIRLRLGSSVFSITFKGKIGIVSTEFSQLKVIESVLERWFLPLKTSK